MLCTDSRIFSNFSSDRTFALLEVINTKQFVKDFIAIDCKNISARTDREVNIF